MAFLPLVIESSSVCPSHYLTISAVDTLDFFEELTWHHSNDKRRTRECDDLTPPLILMKVDVIVLLSWYQRNI